MKMDKLNLEITPETADALCRAIYFTMLGAAKKDGTFKLDQKVLDVLKLTYDQADGLMDVFDRLKPDGVKKMSELLTFKNKKNGKNT
jgi:hypothetical protein